MLKHLPYCYLIVIHFATNLNGSSTSLDLKNILDHQLVKTCCKDSEIFDLQMKRCISKDKSKAIEGTKANSLSPYFGSWKKNKTPKLVHVSPTCGFDNYQVVNSTKKVSLSDDSIELSKRGDKSLSFEYNTDYCIELGIDDISKDSNKNDSNIVLIRITCPFKERKKKSIIGLCCPFRKNHDERSQSCNRTFNDAFIILDNVSRYKLNNHLSTDRQFDTNFTFGNFIEPTDCLHRQTLETGRKELILYEDGSINIDGQIIDHSEYCLDDVIPMKQSAESSQTPEVKKYSAILRYCKYPNWYLIWVTKVESLLHLISSVCLMFLMVYMIYKKCQTVFRAMIVTISFNLLCLYLGTALAKLGGLKLLQDNQNLCLATGVMIYSSYLSVMLWLNSLCFDVWSTFPNVAVANKLRINIGRFEGFKDFKFRMYALYGYGIPLLITTISLTINFLPRKYTSGLVVPGFANTRCFLQSRLAVLLYQFVPTGLALFINGTLYVLFVRNILCGEWASQNRERLQRYIRYFL